MIEASKVIDDIVKANTPYYTRKAKKQLEDYAKQQKRRTGSDPVRTKAAIKAHVTRRTTG